MYTRLTSRRLPSMIMETENEWEIAKDKASVIIKGTVAEDGALVVGPIAAKRHALHVYRNPELGPTNLQIITEDDGPVTLLGPTKKNTLKASDLSWHYKVFVVRVAFPDY